MPEIANFIECSAKGITPALARLVLHELPKWKLNFSYQDSIESPHYLDQLSLLEDILEDSVENVYMEIPYHALAEIIFAVIYCHRRQKMILEHKEFIPHADDSLIIRSILLRHHKIITQYLQHGGKCCRLNFSEP